MNRSTYRQISEFGSNSYSDVNNPLSYCLNNNMNQLFMHGGSSYTLGQNSKACNAFLSDYCAENWDGFCELASKNNSNGDQLVRNTAIAKYLVSMGGNCKKKYEPFDPTVATSPMISYWTSDNSYDKICYPVYSVDPSKIDNDVVMNKILARPIIAIDILINIFNTMKRNGTLENLRGTKLGYFYANNPYFKSKTQKESYTIKTY